MKNPKPPKSVESLTHDDAKRSNIPTAEYQSVVDEVTKSPIRVAYERRNRDLDPQLVWRGKDEQDWSDLVVPAPPLYIQEKVHPKALIDDLRRETERLRAEQDGGGEEQLDLFGDFNGLPSEEAKTEFYQHEQNWANRMILGDSLQVMASLAEREGLRGKVQCIYFDPPYGIKFNSNFQWSTTSRDVKDGNTAHITREPEQVKAFRDTWRDGIHSYLTYLRDRLTVARDLLTESGSIFVQIGDENVHLLRAVMDEVFGPGGFVSQLAFTKTSGLEASQRLSASIDYLLWYGKAGTSNKYRQLLRLKQDLGKGGFVFAELEDGRRISSRGHDESLPADARYYAISDLTKPGPGARYVFPFEGKSYGPGKRWWGTTPDSLGRLNRSSRLQVSGINVRYIRFLDDAPAAGLTNYWDDTGIAGFASEKVYVVQTNAKVVERCILMTTDPGDLVLDPTCGSGTTAYVAEQWGRRWITIDTSRVALALARARVMGARYPYYLLTDSRDGQLKEAELTQTQPSSAAVHGSIRQGFVYERVPHITLKSIANNTEIDVIHEKWQPRLDEALAALNAALRGHSTPYKVTTGGREGKKISFDAPEDTTFTMPSGEIVPAFELVEWEVPRDRPSDWPPTTQPLITSFWDLRIARQKEIDASIAAKADVEYLYDKPYEDKKKVRVAGPFTVESLSPHRYLGVDADGDLIDDTRRTKDAEREKDFTAIILDNLRKAGVQQKDKEGRITFESLDPWPGEAICAEGRFLSLLAATHDVGKLSPKFQTPETVDSDSGRLLRAGILVGPEFGTVQRDDLVRAARETADAGFDVLIACAFNYEPHSTEFNKLGRVPVLKARMNADLHMAEDLKNTGQGNLFVIFGEPDIEILEADNNQIQVRVNGVDVFDPSSGEVRSDGPDGIACWFIDTDYNEESFFVRHAYFLGASDPYKSLKTTLKAEIDEDAWSTLNSDVSRPFDKPTSGRIAVKVINHLGDEVMKVFRTGSAAPAVEGKA